jgi:hypothetical protein
MPRLGSENLQKQNAGHFGFSHTKIDDLAANGASGYTLVTIVADHSGSTLGFQLPMEAALKEVIGACQKSQRADNLLVRLVTFNSQVTEVHGFRLLSSIILNDYDGVLSPNGLTALYDASTNAIEASNNYGKQLLEQDYDVNGIVVVPEIQTQSFQSKTPSDSQRQSTSSNMNLQGTSLHHLIQCATRTLRSHHRWR